MRFHEVAPHIGLSEHDITVRLLTLSQATWDRLDESQQEQVMKAATESASYARSVQLEQDAEALDLLVEEGATLHEMDREKMMEAVAGPLESVIADMGLTEYHQMIINAE